MNTQNPSSNKALYHGTQIIWYILGLLQLLLAFRFVLKLLAANPTAYFTNIIYTLTYPLVYPFLIVFKSSQIGNSLFEWTSLLAMLVYTLIAWGIVKIFFMSKTISNDEVAIKLNQENI